MLTLGFDDIDVSGPFDDSPLEDRSDVRFFTTDVLDEPVDCLGRVTAQTTLFSDAPGADVSSTNDPLRSTGAESDGTIKNRTGWCSDRLSLATPSSARETCSGIATGMRGGTGDAPRLRGRCASAVAPGIVDVVAAARASRSAQPREGDQSSAEYRGNIEAGLAR